MTPPARPLLNCDLVMKGGITSGIVFPRALDELSRAYRFRNIGGTSAGAIAAAAAAAAELGRDAPGGGFNRLRTLPERLGTNDTLYSLFQPQEATEPLYTLATAGMGHGNALLHAWRVLLAAISGFGGWMLAGALPGGFLLWVGLELPPGATKVLAVSSAALVTLIGMGAGLLGGMLRHVANAVRKNNFGLCKGFAAEEPRPGLVNWLITELDTLAGRSRASTPLTLGDLWGRQPNGDPNPVGQRVINLQMMTTNLTHGRPYSVPFIQEGFYFEKDELKEYFPASVVDWMVDHSDQSNCRTTEGKDGRRVYPMPKAEDMPVIVMTRLSLSFPGLFSAVPLYAIDFRRRGTLGRPTEEDPPPERCWFSDGGICSNLPLHFFDAIIPRWPTFAIDLRDFDRFHDRDEDDESKNVWMPRTNGDGLSEWWNRFDEKFTGERQGGLKSVGGFVVAIVSSARTWRENVQSHAAGFRDRVAAVKMDGATEGGLNLRMEPDIIERVAARGGHAGELIRRRFAEPPEKDIKIGWANHKWVRYRNAMNVIQKMLTELRTTFREHDDPEYAALVTRPDGALPTSFEWTKSQRTAAPLALTEELIEVARAWDAAIDFHEEAPHPDPALRISPPV